MGKEREVKLSGEGMVDQAEWGRKARSSCLGKEGKVKISSERRQCVAE